MGKITKTKKTLHQYFTKKSTSPGKDETNDTIVSNGKLLKYFILFCVITNYTKMYYVLILNCLCLICLFC